MASSSAAAVQLCKPDIKESAVVTDFEMDGISLVIDVHTPYSNSSNKTKTLTLQTTLTSTTTSSLSSGSVMGFAHKAIDSISGTTGSSASTTSGFRVSNTASVSANVGVSMPGVSIGTSAGASHTREQHTSESSTASKCLTLSFGDEKQFTQEMSLMRTATTSHTESQSVTEDIDCPPDHIVVRRVYLYVRPGAVTVVGKVPRWVVMDSFDDTLHEDYASFDARARKQFGKLDKEWRDMRENPQVQYELGCLFGKGECGGTPNLQLALKWFRMAAVQGHDEASKKVDSFCVCKNQVVESIKDTLKLREDGKMNHEEAVMNLQNALVRAPPDFEKLVLQSYKIGESGARAIADVLPQSSLTRLDLNSNSIGDAGARAIASALPQSNLTHMWLNTNSIGESGARAIADVLPQSSLTTLYLGHNSFGKSGVRVIAAVLPQSSVTRLYLGRNSIGESGARAIADVLPQSSLTRLYLPSNSMGDAGAGAIAAVLPQCSLTTLHLNNNSIGDCMKEQLKKAAAQINCYIFT
jgi:Leucine Rich repeat